MSRRSRLSPPDPFQAAAKKVLATIYANPFIPLRQRPRCDLPTPQQLKFLVSGESEVLYGGAARGGKTVALLMAALMYVGVPGYHALLLRRTYQDLARAGQLMDLAREWLGPSSAEWNGTNHRWTFPSGATVQFGHMDNEADVWNYLGTGVAFIGFDELTEFSSFQYRFMFRSRSKPTWLGVPLRTRACSNPGNIGHAWVYRRFIRPREPSPNQRFIPARLEHNPYVDQSSYELSLDQLTPVLYEQQRHGNWEILDTGGIFDAGALTRQRRHLLAGTTGSIMPEP